MASFVDTGHIYYIQFCFRTSECQKKHLKLHQFSCCSSVWWVPCGLRVERIDLFCFVAGCHKRQLNLCLSLGFFWLCFLLFISATFCAMLVCVFMCSVSVILVKLCHVLAAKTPLRKPIRAVLYKTRAEEPLWLVLSPGPT